MLGGEIGPQLINRNSSCLIREGSVLSVKNLVLPSRLHSEAGGDGRRGGPADADHPPQRRARSGINILLYQQSCLCPVGLVGNDVLMYGACLRYTTDLAGRGSCTPRYRN